MSEEMVWKKKRWLESNKVFWSSRKIYDGILKGNFMVILYKPFSFISSTKCSANCLFPFSVYTFSFTGMKRTAMICSKRGMKGQQAAYADQSQTQIE